MKDKTMEAVWYVIEKQAGSVGVFGPFSDLQAAITFLGNGLFPWSDDVLDSIEIVKEYEDVS
jgi:hypothetical protein